MILANLYSNQHFMEIVSRRLSKSNSQFNGKVVSVMCIDTSICKRNLKVNVESVTYIVTSICKYDKCHVDYHMTFHILVIILLSVM
jgi:hypothetical protein